MPLRKTDRATKQPFDPGLKLNERVKQAALANGLGIYPMGGTIDGRQGAGFWLRIVLPLGQIDTALIGDRERLAPAIGFDLGAFKSRMQRMDGSVKRNK